MVIEKESLKVKDAAVNYLSVLDAAERETRQPELFKFAQYFNERVLAELRASEIEGYAERLSTSDSDYVKKFDIIKAFLTTARDRKWTKLNLAVHLKSKKTKSRKNTNNIQPEVVPVTKEGYIKLKEELEALKLKRPQIIDEITKAAADKDFRENAPLEAAREQHGLIEGRIREIEATLKAACIVDNKGEPSLKVQMGDCIVLIECGSGEEMPFKIVGPRETDPSRGKISGVSPVGKAVCGRFEGETVEVIVPAGKMKYQIKKIER
jgi:transcription elongation factor GreA